MGRELVEQREDCQASLPFVQIVIQQTAHQGRLAKDVQLVIHLLKEDPEVGANAFCQRDSLRVHACQ
jgi:hypothetical protein